MLLRTLHTEVLALFDDLDAQVAVFRGQCDLSCPPGCGWCCLTPTVEATVLEFVPLAFHIIAGDAGDSLFHRLEAEDVATRCVLYDASGSAGCCSAYRYRAVVCRLFGFAGNFDRAGVPRLAVCRVMKEGSPEAVRRADAIARHGERLPIFARAAARLAAFSPAMGTIRLPINQAIGQALDKVALACGYSQEASVGGEPVKNPGVI